MPGVFISIPMGKRNGAIPVHRLRRFVRWLQRRWPRLTCELKEFHDDPLGPRASINTSLSEDTPEQLRQSEAVDERVRNYLDGNRVPYEYHIQIEYYVHLETRASLKEAGALLRRTAGTLPDGGEAEAAVGSRSTSRGPLQTVAVSSWFGVVRCCPVVMRSSYPPSPRRPPRERMRGLRKYYKTLRQSAEPFVFDAGLQPFISVRGTTGVEAGSFNYWHYHADWYGFGNLSWRSRRQHLEAHQIIFLRVLKQLSVVAPELQCWWYINPLDSSYDAVYVHTPKPGIATLAADWNAVVPERLREFIPDTSFVFGRSENQGGTSFYIAPLGSSLISRCD